MCHLLVPFLMLRLYYKTRERLGRFWSAEELAQITYTSYLTLIMEKIGLLSFLEDPRSFEEVKEFVGGVRREDVLRKLLEVAVKGGVLQADEDGFKVDRSGVARVKALKGQIDYFEDEDVVYRAAETYLPKTAVEVLKGAEKDRSSPEVALTYYWHDKSSIFKLGREMLLVMGGKGRLRGKTVLDVGCRFGTEPALILEFLDYDCRLIAADFYPQVVDECMQKEVNVNGEVRRLFELENVSFVTLDPYVKEKFPLEDASVDVVYTFQVLQWYSSVQRIIEEFSRVLKRGGILLVGIPLKKTDEVTAQDVFYALAGGYRGFTVEEFKKMLKRAGFTKIQIFRSSFVVARKK
ncbi:MAG: methyltransferase domain-containing protein [Candidatus Freyarchaeota archaeon]|nr:methyltransferase domain-containing protein [Candidatus Jordarchaeia archaeon]